MTRILATVALLTTAFATPLVAQQSTPTVQPAPQVEVTRAAGGYFPTDRSVHTPRAAAIFDRIQSEKDPSER